MDSDFIKAMFLGVDGIANANSAIQAVGCLGMRACHMNNCPVGITRQKPNLWGRVIIEASAQRLQNFFESTVELMCVMAGACGHTHLNQFCRDDLTTWEFEGNARLSTCLHRFTINAAMMKIRSQKPRQETPVADLLPRYCGDGHRDIPEVEWSDTTQQALEQEQMRSIVRQSIDQLPQLYRTVLLLRDIEGLDTQATAKTLEVTTNVVKTRFHRVRQALPDCWCRTLEQPPDEVSPIHRFSGRLRRQPATGCATDGI